MDLQAVRRKLKARSDSTQDLQSPSRTLPGSLPRQPSTNRTGKPSPGVVLWKVRKTGGDEDNEETINTAPPAQPPLIGGVPPPPPPPPGSGGAPPLPPLMGGGDIVLDSLLPSRIIAKPKRKLRPFFWDKMPLRMVTQSLWLEAQDRTNDLNLETLEEMFHLKEKGKPLPSVSSKPSAKTLLDPKKARNLGIFLSRFKLSTKEIDEKLGIFKEEEGALPIDHVIALKRFLPTPDEQEMYKNIKEEDIPNLLQEDQFMIQLCEIPHMDERLDLRMVSLTFQHQYEELASTVTSVLDACHQLYSSQRFQTILEYVLAIGNYINGGTNRGGASGFRLSSLTKMADVRGQQKKDSLLKYLISELKTTSPDSMFFLEDLKSIDKAADSSIYRLPVEVEEMRKDLGKILRDSEKLFLKYQRTEARDVKLIRDVDEFIAEYDEKIDNLREKCKEVNYIYGKLLTRFAEPPSTDSKELFTALTTFLAQFKKTLNEVECGPSAKKKIKFDFAVRISAPSGVTSSLLSKFP